MVFLLYADLPKKTPQKTPKINLTLLDQRAII